MNFRIGQGYDVHRLVNGRPLYLGGILIPFEKGLQGHSDADVLIHAICDALLGALCKGDIGTHFPDNDESIKDIDSKLLLAEVSKLLHSEGYGIVNIDTTIVAQVPKMSPFIDKIRDSLAAILNTPRENISVKATTTEGLGPEGRGESISAMAVALIHKP